MPRFFVEEQVTNGFILQGENGRHAVKSLRMRVGESLTLCDGKGTDYNCEVDDINADTLQVKLLEKVANKAESACKVTLYQCLPKADKMDLIVQKVVELGVTNIVPVISSRCIASFAGKEDKKIARLQKISEEAAKQSGRGIIPKVEMPQKFADVLKNAQGTKIFFYEKGGAHLSTILEKNVKNISVLIGSEGGFSVEEAEQATQNGFVCATLGNRILRTETAGLCAVSIIIYEVDR